MRLSDLIQHFLGESTLSNANPTRKWRVVFKPKLGAGDEDRNMSIRVEAPDEKTAIRLARIEVNKIYMPGTGGYKLRYVLELTGLTDSS